MNGRATCPKCRGTGKPRDQADQWSIVCSHCNGYGTIHGVDGWRPCLWCGGAGQRSPSSR